MAIIVRPLDKEVESLAKACGFDLHTCGESGTEQFLYMLSGAVLEVEEELEKSHESGLCLDTVHALASNLNERMKK